MAGIIGNCLNRWTWLEMAQIARNAVNCQKLLEMAKNGKNGLKWHQMACNGWK